MAPAILAPAILAPVGRPLGPPPRPVPLAQPFCTPAVRPKPVKRTARPFASSTGNVDVATPKVAAGAARPVLRAIA